ncbi:MAG: hypothetical protein QOI13_2995, partial [Paraburkholderia sp.]|nr:hypothetical protein [Paraburkholderia sp.]
MPPRHLSKVLIGLISSTNLIVAHAADMGELNGHVVSATDKHPVAGVHVQVRETGTSVTTSSNGMFRFHKLAAGQYTLVVTAGHARPVEHTVQVRANDTTSDDIVVDAPAASLERVTVKSRRTADVIARATQQAAPNMETIMT